MFKTLGIAFIVIIRFQYQTSRGKTYKSYDSKRDEI